MDTDKSFTAAKRPKPETDNLPPIYCRGSEYFEFLTDVSMNMTAFWVVAPSCKVNICEDLKSYSGEDVWG
jgi:hypothetical protein